MAKELNNKINLGKDTVYKIECEGGLIGFDLEDPTNVDRLKEMYDIFDKADKKYKQNEILINKKNDTKVDKFGMSEKEKAILKSYKEYTNSIVKAVDTFFGEGASDKIFYDSVLNRVVVTVTRAEILIMDILPEHFKKANIKQEEYMKERLSKRSRFVEKDSDVIDLDEEETE